MLVTEFEASERGKTKQPLIKNSNFKQEFWDFKQKKNKENKKLWYFKFPNTNRKSENFSFSEERQNLGSSIQAMKATSLLKIPEIF